MNPILQRFVCPWRSCGAHAAGARSQAGFDRASASPSGAVAGHACRLSRALREALS